MHKSTNVNQLNVTMESGDQPSQSQRNSLFYALMRLGMGAVKDKGTFGVLSGRQATYAFGDLKVKHCRRGSLAELVAGNPEHVKTVLSKMDHLMDALPAGPCSQGLISPSLRDALKSIALRKQLLTRFPRVRTERDFATPMGSGFGGAAGSSNLASAPVAGGFGSSAPSSGFGGGFASSASPLGSSSTSEESTIDQTTSGVPNANLKSLIGAGGSVFGAGVAAYKYLTTPSAAQTVLPEATATTELSPGVPEDVNDVLDTAGSVDDTGVVALQATTDDAAWAVNIDDGGALSTATDEGSALLASDPTLAAGVLEAGEVTAPEVVLPVVGSVQAINAVANAVDPDTLGSVLATSSEPVPAESATDLSTSSFAKLVSSSQAGITQAPVAVVDQEGLVATDLTEPVVTDTVDAPIDVTSELASEATDDAVLEAPSDLAATDDVGTVIGNEASNLVTSVIGPSAPQALATSLGVETGDLTAAEAATIPSTVSTGEVDLGVDAIQTLYPTVTGAADVAGASAIEGAADVTVDVGDATLESAADVGAEEAGAEAAAEVGVESGTTSLLGTAAEAIPVIGEIAAVGFALYAIGKMAFGKPNPVISPWSERGDVGGIYLGPVLGVLQKNGNYSWLPAGVASVPMLEVPNLVGPLSGGFVVKGKQYGGVQTELPAPMGEYQVFTGQSGQAYIDAHTPGTKTAAIAQLIPFQPPVSEAMRPYTYGPSPIPWQMPNVDYWYPSWLALNGLEAFTPPPAGAILGVPGVYPPIQANAAQAAAIQAGDFSGFDIAPSTNMVPPMAPATGSGAFQTMLPGPFFDQGLSGETTSSMVTAQSGGAPLTDKRIWGGALITPGYARVGNAELWPRTSWRTPSLSESDHDELGRAIEDALLEDCLLLADQPSFRLPSGRGSVLHDLGQCPNCPNDATYYSRRDATPLPTGTFFNSTWFTAQLASMPDDVYGEIEVDQLPYRVTINNKNVASRAEQAFVHEMMHAVNEIFKLGLSHDQVHAVGTFMFSETLPAFMALQAMLQQ
jgi:hypothetical protein